MASRYRHWKNRAIGGECSFVTTRCLNFAHCFASESQRDLMAFSLLDDCCYYRAHLHSFVVMINHIHLLVTVPESSTVSKLMQKIKSNSALMILPTLTLEQHQQLAEQHTLSRKKFWQDSFKSTVVFGEAFFNQKVDYIEANPLRAGIVTDPSEYRWSSLWLIKQGFVDEQGDLDICRGRETFQAK